MILPPSPAAVAKVTKRLGAPRDVKLLKTEQDEAELRAWQNEVKRRSRARRRR